MEITLVFALITAITTGLSGALLKGGVVPAKYIPLQNLVIGCIASVIAVALGLYPTPSVAVVTCLSIAMGVGGTYDLVQTKKEVKPETKEEE